MRPSLSTLLFSVAVTLFGISALAGDPYFYNRTCASIPPAAPTRDYQCIGGPLCQSRSGVCVLNGKWHDYSDTHVEAAYGRCLMGTLLCYHTEAYNHTCLTYTGYKGSGCAAAGGVPVCTLDEAKTFTCHY